MKNIAGFALSVGTWYKDPVWLTLEDFQRMKTWGFDTVSLSSYWTYYVNPDWTIDYQRLLFMDRIIDMATQAGIKVILKNRVTWGSDTGQEFRGWIHSWNGIFDPNNIYLGNLCRWIEFLYDRYEANPLVVGVNPVNFPFHKFTQVSQAEIDQYHQALPIMVNSIRRVSNKTIFISPVFKGQRTIAWGAEPDGIREQGYWLKYLPQLVDPNIIYLIDGYGWRDVWKCVSPYDLDAAALEETFKDARDFQGQIMIDEFGVWNDCCETDNAQIYLRDLLDIYTKLGFHWMHQGGYSYAIKMSLLNKDKTVRCPKTLALLMRYAPTPISPIELAMSVIGGLSPLLTVSGVITIQELKG